MNKFITAIPGFTERGKIQGLLGETVNWGTITLILGEEKGTDIFYNRGKR